MAAWESENPSAPIDQSAWLNVIRSKRRFLAPSIRTSWFMTGTIASTFAGSSPGSGLYVSRPAFRSRYHSPGASSRSGAFSTQYRAFFSMIHLKHSPDSVAARADASIARIGMRISAHFWRAITSTSPRSAHSGRRSPSRYFSFAGLSSVISPSTRKNSPSFGVRARVRRFPSMNSWLKRRSVFTVQSPPLTVQPEIRRPPLTTTFSFGAAA